MKPVIDAAIEAARTAIQAKQGVLGTAMDELVSNALAAFDKLSSELEAEEPFGD